MMIYFFMLTLLVPSFFAATDRVKNECHETEFSCKTNDLCISLSWRCDSQNDCPDGSDEINCPNVTCLKNEFQCGSNGSCIPILWKCDLHVDCPYDDSDEFECNLVTCGDGQWRCHDNTSCVRRDWLCDGDVDCGGDGSDEVNCSAPNCTESEFTCADGGQCITALWRCNGKAECSDGSDEEYCPKKHCKSGEFTCFNGDCIYDTWICDGDDDCNDGSDERNCTDWVKTCQSGEFQCRILDRMCIHGDWRCDGDYDCEDQSDEKNCNVTCKADQFLCAENYCIPSSLRCDAQKDCRDGSDEIGCPTQVPDCGNETFDCHGDGSKCIQYILVCDGWNDCGNFEDERVDHKQCYKDNLCDHKNGGCEHICYRSPERSFCSCHAGFQLANNSKTDCLDIDECLTAGVCSHTCVNTKGSYKCKCQLGYQLENGHFCKPTLQFKAELLLVQRSDLRRYDLATKDYTLLVDQKSVEGAMGMDFHLEQNVVYWTEVTKGQIKRMNMSSNIVEVVISDNILSPDGLAVDWIHRHMYWTDTGLNQIEVATLDGGLRRVLIDDGLDEPRAIVLYPSKGLMFWTDWGRSPKIERCGMDGKDRISIINTDITWPNGLTIDYIHDRLYWADAKIHKISSADLNGLGLRVVLQQHRFLSHPFAITVFEDFLYWTDWPSESVWRFNKFGKGSVHILAHDLTYPMDIRILHPYRQKTSQNFCGDNNGGCHHFCLPNSGRQFSCVCTNGYVSDVGDVTRCVLAGKGKGVVTFTRNPATMTSDTLTKNANSTVATVGVLVKGVVTISGQGLADFGHNKDVGKDDKHGDRHVTMIVIFVILAITCFVVLVGVMIIRHHRRRNIKTMNFDNPVYRKTVTEDEKVLVERSSSLQDLPSSMVSFNTGSDV